VLILGGIGTDGRSFDRRTVESLSSTLTALASSPSARAFHTATLLTDGRLLIAGGVSASGLPVKTLDLWDSRKKLTSTHRRSSIAHGGTIRQPSYRMAACFFSEEGTRAEVA